MISQTSNNRPSGSAAKSCDAGIPIVGRTSSTGVYEILKVNSDGSIATGGAPVADSNVPYSPTPTTIATVGGAFAAGVIVGNVQVISTAIDAGIYRINPYYAFDGTTTGSVNFLLMKNGSTVDAYAATRAPFVDTYSPTIANIQTGISGYWHGNAIQGFGGTLQVAYNRSNAQIFYLESGTYNLLIFVDTAINQVAPSQYVGFYEFTKLA